MRRFGWLLFLLTLFPLWADEDDWESYYQEGELVEKVRSDWKNQPQEALFYRNGQLEEKRVYHYDQEGQVKIIVTVYNRDGSVDSWVEDLLLNEDGSLRRMDRSGEGASDGAGWSPRSEWTRSGEDQEIITYEKDGQVKERIVYNGESVKEREVYTYDQKGGLLSLEKTVSDGAERYFIEYNRQGLPGETRYYREGLLVSQTFSTYNSQGLLIEEEVRGRGMLTERTLKYGGGDILEEEFFYLNGLLTRKVYYDGEERTEEIYNKGRLTLRVRYRGTEIIGEEEIQ
ncbi:MAG: hypothetical protein PQJ60_04710 [Spirochaetales bacterium]|nr:hypothetical protein [Spirochaetales bacterium]